MAKQTGEYKITGTYDDVTYYRMEGQYYARAKSSLKGSRVKRDPRFRRTMQSAHRFGKGNQLASKVYRSLPKEAQVYALFTELKSIAILAIKEGKSEAEVMELLQERVAAGSRASGCARPVVGSMKKPQATARKAGGKYSLMGVSREGRLEIGNVRRETSNVRQESGCTLYVLRCTEERQVPEVGVHWGKRP